VLFTKRLREGVRRGAITCSVRIWTRPHVQAGARYRMDEGQIEVDSILPISLADITPDLARRSGFNGVIDLLKTAKHGGGENVYLVRFHYLPPDTSPRVPSRGRRPTMPASPIERLRRTCLAFPEAYEKVSHGEPTFWVGKKMFASFADASNHHGAGRHAVWCKTTHLNQDLLVSRSPDRYFVPPYVGPSGWVGIYLDRHPAWTDVAERLRESYRLVAPSRLLATVDADLAVKRKQAI
jgi:hypothetical protein